MAKYSKKVVAHICKLIESDSYTIVEICTAVGISKETFYTWKESKPDFSDAVKKAEETRLNLFVAEAKKSLLKKIQGYVVDESKTVTVDSGKKDAGGKTIPKIKEQTISKKYIQPDTAAIIFTLTNHESELWKNRQNNELTGKGGKDLIPALDYSKLSNDELKILHALQKKANGS